MLQTGAQRFTHLTRRWRIPQSDCQIAEPALVTDAPDRRAAQALVELLFRPPEKLDHRGAIETVAHREIGLGARLRETVPRTDELAIVATVDAVADQRPQLLGNRALVLDGEIRDAAPCIELVRRNDGLRWTDVDAAVAGAAVLICRYVGRQRQVGVHLAEEEPRSGAVQKQRVLAAPADARAGSELDLHHRRRIGEHAVAEGADLILDAGTELLQPIAQHLVVIAAARIARDVRPFAHRRHLVLADAVIHAARDHSQRAWLKLGRARAEGAMTRHILHLAMPSMREPFEQARLRRGEVAIGDAHRLEAELAPPSSNALRERGVIHDGRS